MQSNIIVLFYTVISKLVSYLILLMVYFTTRVVSENWNGCGAECTDKQSMNKSILD